jgi:hypothetical protein
MALRLISLMIITPRDSDIAKCCLSSLRKHIPHLPNFSLLIYQNGLSELQEQEISTVIRGTPWLSVSNRSRLQEFAGNLEVGAWYRTEEGGTAFRQGMYESPDEIWSRELVRLDSPLVGIIDADFEVFDPSFIPEMIQAFADDDKLAIFATEHSPTQKVFETYSQIPALVMERWDTWFCIYRKAALEQTHDFSYREFREESSELPIKYDHSAWLQKCLIEGGWHGRELERSQQWKYLHYGAFSKNRSLSKSRLRFYRFFRVLRHSGFRHWHKSEFAANQLRRLGNKAYRWLGLEVYDRERQRYPFDQQ